MPNDGRYYLILKGKIIKSFRIEKQALKAYREKAKELGFKPETSQPKIDWVKEATDKFFEKYDAYWNNSHKFRKGGRGK